MSDIRPYGLDPTHLGEDEKDEEQVKKKSIGALDRTSTLEDSIRAFNDRLRADTPFERGQIGLDGQYYPDNSWDE